MFFPVKYLNINTVAETEIAGEVTMTRIEVEGIGVMIEIDTVTEAEIETEVRPTLGVEGVMQTAGRLNIMM